MAVGKGISGVGRAAILVFAGAALGTMIGFGVSRYSNLLSPLADPLIKLDFPFNTYLDFFFVTFSFAFTLRISAATILGGLFGYWIARRW